MAKKIYSQEYIRACFDAWYLNGRPNSPSAIKKILPPMEGGLPLPTTTTLNRWMIEGTWDLRADELDAAVTQKDDALLINKKAEMLRLHQEQSMKVTQKALEYLLKDVFDSASSAVQAFFKGLEEQRKTAGFSDLLEKLDKMSNNEVEREIIEKLRRIQENDQIIEVESDDVPELEGGEEFPG